MSRDMTQHEIDEMKQSIFEVNFFQVCDSLGILDIEGHDTHSNPA